MQGLQSVGRHHAKAHRSRKSNGAAHRTVVGPAAGPLQSSVLVLNRLYCAVHVVNVRRAFGMLFRERAEVIHFEEGAFANYNFRSWREVSQLRAEAKQPHEDWVRAVSFQIQVPRVIRLLQFDRLPKRQLRLSRRSVLARDEHTCQYCGRQFPSRQLSLDHVIPRSCGGTTTWENVVCACLECNVKKGGRTPKGAKMKLVRHPVKPRHNPVLLMKLSNPKYESWRTWLDGVSWDLGFRI